MNFKEYVLYEMFLKEDAPSISTLEKINNIIMSNYGEIYVVGGPIRDLIVGVSPKDIDFLVRKLSLQRIGEIISSIGKSNEVGQSFGIVKGIVDGYEFDFAIPRTKEIKTGDKHTDFEVQTDPNAKVEDDLGRRDLTINAMAVRLSDFIEFSRGNLSLDDLKQKIIDPYGGLVDITRKQLRAVGNPIDRFMEDPLRILRTFQFASRMDFNLSDSTLNAIAEIADSIKTIPGDRVLEEFKKSWIKGKNQETFVSYLTKTGIGKILFGDDYNPIPIEIVKNKSAPDKVAGNFVAHFINGGEYMNIRPTAELVKIIQIVKRIKEKGIDFNDLSFLKKLNKLDVINEVSKFVNPERKEIYETALEKPTSLQELEINGQDIMDAGLKGKEIGNMVNRILSEIWNDKLINNKNKILEFIKLNALKGN